MTEILDENWWYRDDAEAWLHRLPRRVPVSELWTATLLLTVMFVALARAFTPVSLLDQPAIVPAHHAPLASRIQGDDAVRRCLAEHAPSDGRLHATVRVDYDPTIAGGWSFRLTSRTPQLHDCLLPALRRLPAPRGSRRAVEIPLWGEGSV